MSLGRRLSLAFASVVLIIAVGAAIASWQFLSISHQARMLAAVDGKLIAVYRVRADIGAIRRQLDEAVKAQDAITFGNLAERLRRDSFADIGDALSHFRETGTPIPGTLIALRDAVGDQFDAMQRLREVGDWTAISLRLDEQVDQILDTVREMVDNISSDVSAQRLRAQNEIETAHFRSQVILALTGLASLGASLVLGVYTTRSIVGPLSRLKSAAHQLAEGDFNISPEIKTNDELAEVGQAFVVAAGKLQEYYVALKRSNEDLERFAYVASHDLQEPLRTITAFSDLLKVRCEEAIPPEGQQYLSYLASAAARMRQLITGILEYSRLASAGEPISESIDVEDIVAVVLQNLHATIVQTGAVVTYQQLPRVAGRRLQLIQLFQNLIANAIKYRREGIAPRIHISGKRQGAMWQFSVEDNGIGIDPKYHSQVFGMFNQINRGTQGGVGVGLAISKRIVEQHGGEISIASRINEGSRFYFTLKAAKTSRVPEASEEVSSAK